MTTGYAVLMFGLGLALLIWGSDLFVESAVRLAEYFHMPDVVIGATIVSLGTTLPEVLFSTTASWKGLSDMALGNALGSILCNTGFIAGMMLLLSPVRLERKAAEHLAAETFFLTAGFFLYVGSGILFGGLPRVSGTVLAGICILFVGYTLRDTSGQSAGECKEECGGRIFGISDALRLLLEMAAVYIGADMLATYGPELARAMGVPEMIISLTFVALGTSLPELVTSLAAWRKKHAALSLGNIIGADILNLALVGGASAVICPITYPESILRRELPFVFLLLSILCIPSLRYRKAGRFQGILLLAGYVWYLILMKR